MTEQLGDVWPATRWDGHRLLMTPAAEEAAGVAAWARRGLHRGEKMIFAADGPHDTVEALVPVLLAAGCAGAERAADTGQLVVVDPRRFRARYEAMVDEALREGHPGVRSYSAPASTAGALDEKQFEGFEDALERMWHARGATAVCRYKPGLVDVPEALRAGIRRHSSGCSETALQAHSPEDGLLRLVGEVDVANDHLLAELLRAAVRRAGDVLLVDCSGLAFVSVAGWRAVVATTEEFRSGGGRVRLASLPPIAARLLQVTGYHTAFELDSCPEVESRFSNCRT